MNVLRNSCEIISQYRFSTERTPGVKQLNITFKNNHTLAHLPGDTHTHTCPRANTHARHVISYTHGHTHSHTHALVQTHAHTHARSLVRTHAHARTHTRKCTNTHVHTHAHTHACAYTRTRTHARALTPGKNVSVTKKCYTRRGEGSWPSVTFLNKGRGRGQDFKCKRVP